MCSINVWGGWRVPTRSSLHILLSLMQFKQHRSVQWKDILHVTGRLSCLDSSLEGLIASRWISAINQFFWIQPSFIYLMCPSSHTPDQWQRERPLFPAWKFKLHCHDEGVNSNHYANHQFLNSNVPRIVTGARDTYNYSHSTILAKTTEALLQPPLF